MKRFEANLKRKNEENIFTKTANIKLHANVEAILKKQDEENVPRYMRLTRKQIMRTSQVGKQIDDLEAKKKEKGNLVDNWNKGNETINKFEDTLKARKLDFEKTIELKRAKEEQDTVYQKFKEEETELPRYMRR
jgi:hypothetical protein